jgi:hypothetical protein
MKTKCKYCGMETPITRREVCGVCSELITVKDAEKRYTGLIEDDLFEKG